MNLYVFYRIVQFISRKLPRGFAYWLGMRVADGCYFFDRKGRKAVRSNLRHILEYKQESFTERQLACMARRNFQYFGKYLIDFFRFARLKPEDISRLVDIENLHYLEDLKKSQQGTILMTAHLGNWEMGGAFIVALGYPVSAVFQPENLTGVNRMFQEHRSSRGMHVIPLGNAARNVMGILKNQGTVAIVADRDFTPHQHYIDFFGSPARLPSGPARLAFHLGTPILPVFILRQPNDRFLMQFFNPINPKNYETLDELRGAMRDVLQEAVTKDPLQWFIFENFWQTTNSNTNKGQS